VVTVVVDVAAVAIAISVAIVVTDFAIAKVWVNVLSLFFHIVANAVEAKVAVF
jgi:hypothetical protein